MPLRRSARLARHQEPAQSTAAPTSSISPTLTVSTAAATTQTDSIPTTTSATQTEQLAVSSVSIQTEMESNRLENCQVRLNVSWSVN